MTKFSMTCTCDDEMDPVEGETKEEAIEKLQDTMNPEEVDKHWSEKHPGQPVPSLEEVHDMIAQHTHEITE